MQSHPPLLNKPGGYSQVSACHSSVTVGHGVNFRMEKIDFYSSANGGKYTARKQTTPPKPPKNKKLKKPRVAVYPSCCGIKEENNGKKQKKSKEEKQENEQKENTSRPVNIASPHGIEFLGQICAVDFARHPYPEPQ